MFLSKLQPCFAVWAFLLHQKKRMALLEKFGTIDKIISADVADLCQVDGIGEELAKKIYTYFKEEL